MLPGPVRRPVVISLRWTHVWQLASPEADAVHVAEQQGQGGGQYHPGKAVAGAACYWRCRCCRRCCCRCLLLRRCLAAITPCRCHSQQPRTMSSDALHSAAPVLRRTGTGAPEPMSRCCPPDCHCCRRCLPPLPPLQPLGLAACLRSCRGQHASCRLLQRLHEGDACGPYKPPGGRLKIG